MSLYIRSSASGSQKYLYNLLHHLSGDYYPIDVADSAIGDIYSGYSDQLNSGSNQIDVAHQNTALTTAIGSSIYNNYAALIPAVSGLFTSTITSNLLLYCYRVQLTTLNDSFIHGSTNYGLYKLGQGLTGYAALIEQHNKTPRWRLSTATGSFSSITNTEGIDPNAFWQAHTWKQGLFFNYSKQELSPFISTEFSTIVDNTAHQVNYHPLGFTTGSMDYVLTHSRLGTNTRLYDKGDLTDGVDISYWIPLSIWHNGSLVDYPQWTRGLNYSSSSLQSALSIATQQILPSHVKGSIQYYNAAFGFGYLSQGSYSSDLVVNTNDIHYVTNSNSTTGSIYTSPIYQLSTSYFDTVEDWYIDWYGQEINRGYVTSYYRFSDDPDALITAPWTRLSSMNQWVSPTDLGGYGQFKLEVYASSSNEIKFYGWGLKGKSTELIPDVGVYSYTPPTSGSMPSLFELSVVESVTLASVYLTPVVLTSLVTEVSCSTSGVVSDTTSITGIPTLELFYTYDSGSISRDSKSILWLSALEGISLDVTAGEDVVGYCYNRSSSISYYKHFTNYDNSEVRPTLVGDAIFFGGSGLLSGYLYNSSVLNPYTSAAYDIFLVSTVAPGSSGSILSIPGIVNLAIEDDKIACSIGGGTVYSGTEDPTGKKIIHIQCLGSVFNVFVNNVADIENEAVNPVSSYPGYTDIGLSQCSIHELIIYNQAIVKNDVYTELAIQWGI